MRTYRRSCRAAQSGLRSTSSGRRKPGPRRCGRRASGIGPERSDRFQRPSLQAARELEQLLRACQIWTVEHAALVADRADAGIGGEQIDDLLRLRDLGFVRHERFVDDRSEEHTSELQSLMRISYAVFCLKKKKRQHISTVHTITITPHMSRK